MSTPLTCAVDRTPGGGVTLTVTGEVDMSNAAALAAALAEAWQTASEGTFTVDLTAVEYIDSAGLAALFPYVEQLRLVAGPLIGPVLAVAGLDDLTTVANG